MGTTLNSVEPLGEPFRSVDEQVFLIPVGSSNEVASSNLFKIIFMLEGSCFHQIEDQPRVFFQTGDIMVIPRRCRQRYWPLAPHGPHRLHALRLVFDPTVCPAYPTDHRPVYRRGDVERDFTSFVRHHLQEVRHLPQGQDNTVRQLLTQLRHEAEQQQAGYRFQVTALCTALVVAVVRQLGAGSGRASPSGQPGRLQLVHVAREFLLKNLHRELHLAEVAGHLGVSPEHLARVFKQQTGQTLFTYLQHLRLEKAKTLLIGSDKSIGAIAALTGFSSLALFSRVFKRHIGASPLQYRQERWSGAVEKIYTPSGQA